MPKRSKQLREFDEAEAEALFVEQDPVTLALEPFLADGLITEVLYPVKRGKEATVYCCQAGSMTGYDLLAAKVYRPTEHRAFKHSAIYEEGRVIGKGQVRRAVEKKTRFGKQAHFALWINHEYETLKALARADIPAPRPLAQSENALLMEYFGDREGAAPALAGVTLAPEEARAACADVLEGIERCLAHHVVHGDLSAYNILFWDGHPRTIDFPQAVDPRFNPSALFLLTRDLEHVCAYFARYGLRYDGRALAGRLWQRYRTAQL